MKLHLGIAAWLAVGSMGLSRGVGAPAPVDPCSVLTDAEVGGAIGAAVSAHRGQGNLMSNDRGSCTWTSASAKQKAVLAIGRIAQGARVQNKDWIQQMTQLGYTIEPADNTPTLWCGRVVETTKVTTHVLAGSGGRCEAVMKGFWFALDISGPNVTTPQIKALVDKLVGRLPA